MKYNLLGPKGRLYVFERLPDGYFRVARYEDTRRKRDELKTRGRARSLYAFLVKLGYHRV